MTLRRDVEVSSTFICDVCDTTEQSSWNWWTLVAPQHEKVNDFCSLTCLSQWVNQ